jgi:hypothetical protein
MALERRAAARQTPPEAGGSTNVRCERPSLGRRIINPHVTEMDRIRLVLFYMNKTKNEASLVALGCGAQYVSSHCSFFLGLPLVAVLRGSSHNRRMAISGLGISQLQASLSTDDFGPRLGQLGPWPCHFRRVCPGCASASIYPSIRLSEALDGYDSWTCHLSVCQKQLMPPKQCLPSV